MRNPGGYAHWSDGFNGESDIERDTFTCNHCCKVVFVKPKEDPANVGGLCKVCMSLICPRCVGRPGCVTFEAKMERAEVRDRSRRSMGL